MSTSVVEEVPAEVADFKQPNVVIGDTVEFYDGGVRGASPTIATVIKVNANSVNLRLRDESNKLCYGVRHIDDPAIPRNDNFKRSGAWDWTERHRQWERAFKGFGERLAVLERLANSERKSRVQ